MELEEVQSSNISHVGYDSEKQELTVRFKHGAALYRYKDFSKEEWKSFRAAESIGSHFTTKIRPHFTGEKVPLDETVATS